MDSITDYGKFRCTNKAVQKTRVRGATRGSSVALAWAVQDRDPEKFRRTNEGITGGHDLGKFRHTKRGSSP
jgi:hypothetical protein